MGALLILAVTVAAFYPAIGCGFIWDDDHYVSDNPVVREPGGLRRAWFEIGATPQFYPLVFTTFWIEHRLWGLRPAGYHVVNILLHAAAAILLWRVLCRLNVPGAYLAAVFFAVHPVQVESVAWITERKNVLSGVFYLAALATYLRFVGRTGASGASQLRGVACGESTGQNRPHSGGLYGLSLGLFVCAMLSKSVTCSLPAAILLILWWKRGVIRRRDILPLAPFFVLGLGFAGLTAWMERAVVGAEGADWDLSSIDRILIAGRAFWFYVGKLIWPQPLVFIYPRWAIDARAPWQYVFPIAFCALILGLWLARRRVGRGPLVATLLFAGTLTPALGFINVYPMRFSFVADHFQYLACIAAFALIAALWARLGRRFALPFRRICHVAGGVIVLLLAVMTWRQCHVYENEETLWTDTLQRNGGAWMAHGNLGKYLVASQRFDEGIEHCRIALKARPDLPSAHCNLAGALISAGRPADAISHLEKALRIKPDHLRALHDLGFAFLRTGRPTEAVIALERANQVDPRVFRIHQLLGEALTQLGDDRAAIEHYEVALRLGPNSAATHQALGLALAHRGDRTAAIEHFRDALRLRPNFPEAWANLAAVLGSAGHPDEAMKCLDRAITLKPEYANARFNLGCLLAEAGRRAEAIAQFKEVLRLKPDDGEAAKRLRALQTSSSQPDREG